MRKYYPLKNVSITYIYIEKEKIKNFSEIILDYAGFKVSEIKLEGTHVILINSYCIYKFVKVDDNIKENMENVIVQMNSEYIDKSIGTHAYDDERELHTYIEYIKPKQ